MKKNFKEIEGLKDRKGRRRIGLWPSVDGSLLIGLKTPAQKFARLSQKIWRPTSQRFPGDLLIGSGLRLMSARDLLGES